MTRPATEEIHREARPLQEPNDTGSVFLAPHNTDGSDLMTEERNIYGKGHLLGLIMTANMLYVASFLVHQTLPNT